MHEAGHAMYNQGVDHALDRTLIDHGASLAVHESQSRLWENLVGRSLPFWEHFYPRLQAYFPEQLGKIGLEDFYRGINAVKPSLIRVEADEATYNLHVMLRLEIEIGLIEGSLAVKDLPEIWNARMAEFLGVTPPNDAQGVLQDIHWSMGMIGYFSTYSLGNLISVQLWERLQADIPDLTDQIRQGEFGGIARLAARENPPARGEVRATGSGAAGDRLQDRPGALPAVSEDQVRRNLRPVRSVLIIESSSDSCSSRW